MKRVRYGVVVAALIGILAAFQNCGSTSGPALTETGGGVTPDPHRFGFDDAGPDIVFLATPPQYTKDGKAHFEVTADDHGGIGLDRIEYQVDDGIGDNFNWFQFGGILDLSNLQDGVHKIFIRALDLKGNIGEAKFVQWTVDNGKPVLTLNGKPADQSKSTLANFIYSATDAHDTAPVLKNCLLNNVVLSDCDGATSVANLAPDFYTFKVTAVDKAGNSTTIRYDFTVLEGDGDLPTPGFTKKPGVFDSRSTATFRFEPISVTGVTVTCKFTNRAGTNAVNCPLNQDFEITGLKEQVVNGAYVPYTLTATFKGKNGRSVNLTWGWTVDMILPKLVFESKASGAQTTNKVNFNFNATDRGGIATTVCKLDGSTTPCSEEHDNIVTTSAGTHTFQVIATDPAGNANSKTFTFSVPSCRLVDLDMRWPVTGTEGKHWIVTDLVDRNAGSGLKDYTGATGANSRASDESKDIIITTGNSLTLSSDPAKVVAVESGKIVKIIRSHASSKVYVGASFTQCVTAQTEANMIDILHANGFHTYYYHLKDIPAGLAAGQDIAKGAFLGRMGYSGCTEFPQLRLTTKNCDREVIDPIDSKRFGGKITDSHRKFEVMRTFMVAGSYSYLNNSHWNHLMINPPTATSFKKSGTATLAGFVGGGITTDKLQVTLTKPGGSAVQKLLMVHGQGAGFYFSAASGTLDVTGTWTWRVYQIKANGDKEQVFSDTFQVTN